MLKGLHFLLTYSCTFECDHCFLYCSPRAEGTFTIESLQRAFDQAAKIDTLEWIYFEGGEPFLYYPLMLRGIELACRAGYKVGIVTNAYWAHSKGDAELWLRPLAELGIDDLSISDDLFHQSDHGVNTARVARSVAEEIGLPVGTICIDPPAVNHADSVDQQKGEPVVGGDVQFRGRAVEKLSGDLPRRHWQRFDQCPHEDFTQQSRVHVDPYGNVHLCQGILLGNMWQTDLKDLFDRYNCTEHPICDPIERGGPSELARTYGLTTNSGYVDACHLCFELRKQLLTKFPEYLAPAQVYGLSD